MRKWDSLLKKVGFCIKNRDNTVKRSRMIKLSPESAIIADRITDISVCVSIDQ